MGELSDKLRTRFTQFRWQNTSLLNQLAVVERMRGDKRIDRCWHYARLYHDSVFSMLEEHLFKATRVAYREIIKLRTIMCYRTPNATQREALRAGLKALTILVHVARRPLPEADIDPAHSAAQHWPPGELKKLVNCRAYLGNQWPWYGSLYDNFRGQFVTFPGHFVDDLHCIHSLFAKLEANDTLYRFGRTRPSPHIIDTIELIKELAISRVGEANSLDTNLHQLHSGLRAVEAKEMKRIDAEAIRQCKPVLERLDLFYHLAHSLNYIRNRALIGQLNLMVNFQAQLFAGHFHPGQPIPMAYELQFGKYVADSAVTTTVTKLITLFDSGHLNDIKCYDQLAGPSVGGPRDGVQLHQLLLKLSTAKDEHTLLGKIGKLIVVVRGNQLGPIASLGSFTTTSPFTFPSSSSSIATLDKRNDLEHRDRDVYDRPLNGGRPSLFGNGNGYLYYVITGAVTATLIILALLIALFRHCRYVNEMALEDAVPTTAAGLAVVSIPLEPMVPAPQHLRSLHPAECTMGSWL